MGRSRSFDEQATLHAAAELFCREGYEGTSVDDLVTSLGIHRGSLYNAYGSKRGLFLASLRHHVQAYLGPASADVPPADRGQALDLLLVAAVERGQRDDEVAEIVRSALSALDDHEKSSAVKVPSPALTLLAERILRRLDREGDMPSTTTVRRTDGTGPR